MAVLGRRLARSRKTRRGRARRELAAMRPGGPTGGWVGGNDKYKFLERARDIPMGTPDGRPRAR